MRANDTKHTQDGKSDETMVFVKIGSGGRGPNVLKTGRQPSFLACIELPIINSSRKPLFFGPSP
jgi:hypothetical protein